MSKIAVVIPCYNEALRLKKEEFIRFAHNLSDVTLFFVNDGSTDNTQDELESIRNAAPAAIRILSLPVNKGKAHAVSQGIKSALAYSEYSHIGYLDADLSTSTSEMYRLYQLALTNSYDYVLGSRIKLLNTVIERSFFRHLAGRVIATLIDSRYKLGVYDTQCGAKCFTNELAHAFAEKPFYTKWFFDVEILLRLRRLQPSGRGVEIPLTGWKDPGNSRISILNFAGVIRDIYFLFTRYAAK